MEQVKDILQLLNPLANLSKLNKVDQIPTFKIVEQKSGIKPSQIAVLLVLFVLFFLASYFMRVSNIFVWFFCYFFPGYFTLIALRDKNEALYPKYLVYWVVYPLLLQSQPLFTMLFNRTIFNLVRVILTALFLSPKIDLSTRFYESVLRPFLENEKTRAVTGQIDNFVQQGGEKIEQVKNKLKKQ